MSGLRLGCYRQFLRTQKYLKRVNWIFFTGVKEFEARWIGWAGVNVPDEAGQRALTKALAEKVQSFRLQSFHQSA